MAQKEGVQIHSHDVIYRFLDDVKSVMSGLLPLAFEETVIGEAKILKVSRCVAWWSVVAFLFSCFGGRCSADWPVLLMFHSDVTSCCLLLVALSTPGSLVAVDGM